MSLTYQLCIAYQGPNGGAAADGVADLFTRSEGSMPDKQQAEALVSYRQTIWIAESSMSLRQI
jgi:hypothetical protein